MMTSDIVLLADLPSSWSNAKDASLLSTSVISRSAVDSWSWKQMNWRLVVIAVVVVVVDYHL